MCIKNDIINPKLSCDTIKWQYEKHKLQYCCHCIILMLLLSLHNINVIVVSFTWAIFPNQMYKEKVVWIKFFQNFKSVNIPVKL